MSDQKRIGEYVKNVNHDLERLVEKDIQDTKDKRPPREEMTLLEYLTFIRRHPEQSVSAHQRVFSVIDAAGYEEINWETDPRRARILCIPRNATVRLPKFLSKIFYGIEETLIQTYNHLYSAAQGGEESRQVFYWYGPVSSGKSTIAEALRRGLEEAGFWEIKGCPVHDDPLAATPRSLRPELSELGIYIDSRAEICPVCRWHLKEEFDNDYTKFTVVWRKYSQRGNCGIAVVSEVDPINFNIGVLIGEEDIAKLGDYERGHPLTLRFTGAYNRGNRGVVEFVEMFKNPPEANRTVITATQEKYVPGPKLQGQVYQDSVLIAHSNEGDWNKFNAEQTTEAIIDRILKIKAPYTTQMSADVRIHRDKFLASSSFLRNIHTDPHALELVSIFSTLTRLRPSNKVQDPMTKLRLYDGEEIPERDQDKTITLAELRAEAGLREGMVGISYREVQKHIIGQCLASYRDQWERDPYLKECNGYLNPLWILDTLTRYVQNCDIPEDSDNWERPSKKRWLSYVQIVQQEWCRRLDNDITASVLGEAFDRDAQSLFQNYYDHARAWIQKKKVHDDKTQEELDPDVKFLESIEQHLGKTGTAASSFRSEVVAAIGDCHARGEKVTWRSYPLLQDAIEKKLKSTVKDLIAVSVGSDILDKEQRTNRNQISEALKKTGYAEFGIDIILRYARNHLYRD